MVKTVIQQANGRGVPIDYTVAKSASGWKIYDISVDGVSLVVNYRSSFAQEIQQGGIAQLITKLKNKNNGALAESKKA